jgi:DMSO/TMAO reductase YedYZ molybdopterin-dependent catalytic subunit
VRRIQRVPESWPVVHLEDQPPAWDGLTVGGHVMHPRRFDLADLAALGAAVVTMDFHCVWGWSRPATVWEGVPMARVLEVVRPEAGFVTVGSTSGVYSACLPAADAGRGVLAWARDGVTLAPDAGGPLRFVPPADYWAYKGVKWAGRIEVVDRFVPGFWEAKVADPVGLVPDDVVRP